MITVETGTRVSGYGIAATRKNEITADDLAVIRNFIMGYDYGVIGADSFKLTAYASESRIHVTRGLMYAYGYLGYMPTDSDFYIVPPSVPQYYIVYAEIDKSVIPNTFKISILNNQGSDKVDLRQDVLSSVRTGIFRMPLHRLLVYYNKTDDGIDVKIGETTDLRVLNLPVQSVTSVDSAKVITESLGIDVSATTQSAGDISNKVATTAFVDRAVTNEVNR